MDPAPASLSSRRRRATELEIAETAARLMAEHGPSGVTVENIASEAGVGLRTFYRYFRNKYDAIAPLLTVGAADWRETIAHSDRPIVEAIDEAIRGALTVTTDRDQQRLDEVLSLLDVVTTDPDLASVWLRVNQESEAQLQTIIAAAHGAAAPEPFRDRLLAAAATIAMRVAIETWSLGLNVPEDGSVAEAASRGFRSLVGLSAWSETRP